MFCVPTLSVPIPFCREYRTEFNLTWNENQTQVNYDLNITYVFEPNMSSGDPQKDHIISLNIPLYVSQCTCLPGYTRTCTCT